MRKPAEAGNLEFRYWRLGRGERRELLRLLRGRLKSVGGIVFAYVHGGFVEREYFRDVDVAAFVRDASEAFSYAVDLSARLESDLGIPVDVHVLNEAPLPFRHRVFTEGALLLSRDEGLRLRIVDLTLREYFDLRKLTEEVVKSLLSPRSGRGTAEHLPEGQRRRRSP